MSRKKKTARDKSTRQLMGIDSISEYGIRTPFGELAYFFVRPTNISVLSESGVSERIGALLGVLQGETDAEILALDSAETFDSNKRLYHSRADAEELSTVRSLLEQDTEHLDSIQTQMVSAREFCIISRLRDVKDNERHTLIPRLEKSIKDSGFTRQIPSNHWASTYLVGLFFRGLMYGFCSSNPSFATIFLQFPPHHRYY